MTLFPLASVFSIMHDASPFGQNAYLCYRAISDVGKESDAYRIAADTGHALNAEIEPLNTIT